MTFSSRVVETLSTDLLWVSMAPRLASNQDLSLTKGAGYWSEQGEAARLKINA